MLSMILRFVTQCLYKENHIKPTTPPYIKPNMTKDMTIRCAARTVSFFAHNTELREMIPQFLDMIGDNFRSMLATSSKVTSETQMTKAMMEIKTDIETLSKTIPQQLDQKFEDITSTLVKTLSTIISSQMDENTIKLLDSLKPERFLKTITDSIQTTMSQGEVATAKVIEQLTKDATAVTKLAQTQHEHMMTLIKALPNDFMAITVASTSSSHNNHETRMLALIQELQNAITASAVATSKATSDEKMMNETLKRLNDDMKTLFCNMRTSVDASTTRDHTATLSSYKTLDTNITKMFKDAKDRDNATNADFSKGVEKIPNMVKSIFAEVVKEMTATHTATQGILQGETRDLLAIRKTTDEVQKKLDTLTGILNASVAAQAAAAAAAAVKLSAKAKGTQGEKQFYTAFTDYLSNQPDGSEYTVTAVSGLAHNCDYNVKRQGYNDIRIEIKTHGAAVGGNDVLRFKSDLEGVHLAGIMISLHSGIVHKHVFDMEMLSTGKYAMYLSNNEYNMDLVHKTLKVLYTFDQASSSASSVDQTSHKISAERMMIAKLYLNDMGSKMEMIRTYSKSILAVLGECTFGKVDEILMGVAPAPAPAPAVEPFVSTPTLTITSNKESAIIYKCVDCDRVFKTKGAYGSHVRIHK